MQRHGWLLWTILPLLLFAAIWWLTTPRADPTVPGMGFVGNERPTGPVPTRAEMAALQSKADTACQCSRAGDHDQCWASYRQDIARFRNFETGTACMEESVTLDCFMDDGLHDRCITTNRPYGACSDAEQRQRISEIRRRGGGGCGG